MNPESIIDLLEPLRQPDPVSFWPPAPGWWVLAMLVLVLLAYGLYQSIRYYRRGAALREARVAVLALNSEPRESAQLAADLNQLLRRVALALKGREAAAGLTGAAWATFLNDLTRDEDSYFDEQLLALAHRPQISDDACAELMSATQRWLGKLERPK